MKRFVLLSILLLSVTGCGRCWRSFFNQGAPCEAGCPAPVAQAPVTPCNDCGTSSSYGVYGDQILDGQILGEQIVGGPYVSDGVVTDGYLGGSTTKPLAPLAAPAN